MRIAGPTKLAGVIGWPIAHSLSPRLHRHWLRVHCIDGDYIALAVRPENLVPVIEGLSLAGFSGVNLTLPHKEAAFALAREGDEAARITSAANLLVFGRSGVWKAHNTDAAGFELSLREAGLRLPGQSAAVLGAGGAARATVLALEALGIAHIRLVSRNVARGQAMAASMSKEIAAGISIFAWTDWPEAARDIVLLVNATSGGLEGGAHLELPLDSLPYNATICDLVYRPLETDLLRRARARGHSVIDGLAMLMHQAVPAFEAFYGIRPEVTSALRRELEEALRDGR